jgi:anti-anti-sigma factor
MPITTQEEGRLVTVFVDGAIDSQIGASLGGATQAAIAKGSKRFLVNLQKAKQANSAGLEALVKVAQQVTQGGGRFALVGPSPLLLDILKATRLDRRFAVFESTEQAIQNLRMEV